MLFRRRKPAGLKERLRGLFWPRKGFSRSLRYAQKRVLRLSASPYSVAAGVAAGVIASWTPFIGFHVLLSFAIAFLLAGNMVAAAIGTAFANPLTIPFMWATSWEVGDYILGSTAKPMDHADLLTALEHGRFGELWGPVLKPMLIGSIPPALASGIFFYFVVFFTVRGFRTRRRQRLAETYASRARVVPVASVDRDFQDVGRGI